MPRIVDKFTRKWIIANGVPLVLNSGEELTLRGLHYQLVGIGFPNTFQHYKRVVDAMGKARWAGLIPFESFVDFDRNVIGKTAADPTDVNNGIADAKSAISMWMSSYFKNRWENQPIYPEVFIEKNAQIGVFRKPCEERSVALSPCKGYPSLTFLNDAAKRFSAMQNRGKECVMLYFGDHDPSGDDIPVNIGETLYRMGCSVDIQRIALTKEQVIEMNLPPAPIKKGDSRSAGWDGVGQVEMDAVPPDTMRSMLHAALDNLFDEDLGDELDEIEEAEEITYVKELKEYVKTLSPEEDDDEE